jgi:hypothetical protein
MTSLTRSSAPSVLENRAGIGTFFAGRKFGPEGPLSLVVKLEDDLGERSDWIMLHGVIPGRDEKDFPYLRGIDLYGKTVFNHLQMEMFLEEWERVRERARDESQKDAWQKVKDMALACQDDRDLYLKFVGN